MLPIPCLYLITAIALGIAAPAIDRAASARLPLGSGVDEARDVLTSTATGMIAFTGLVVSSVLLAVQFAAGQYSPRLVLWFRRDRLVRGAGVVTAFDELVLVAAATRAAVTIEIVPAIGEFVARGRPLLRIHGDEKTVDQLICRAVHVAEERTIEQDPAFAIRMIVDTAIRALSPAVNDPTTAVHAIDALEVVMRELAGRDLEQSLARDQHGVTRLVWRVPGWPDLLDLAFDEIRDYGAGSVQIDRRLRAALEDLRTSTPAIRHPALDAQLVSLDEAVGRAHPPGSPEADVAVRADRTGLGMTRP